MHPKRHYKILIFYLFGHPRGTWAFRNDKGFSIIFPKIVDAVKRILTKVKIALIPLSITF